MILAISMIILAPFEGFAEGDVSKGEEEKVARSDVEGPIWKKLIEIEIPKVTFSNTTLEEAVEQLRLLSIECDLEEDDSLKGISFLVRGFQSERRGDEGGDQDDGFDNVADPNAVLIKKLHLVDVPLAIVLNEMCDQTGCRWMVDPALGKVVISPDRETWRKWVDQKLGDIVFVLDFEFSNATIEEVISQLDVALFQGDDWSTTFRGVGFVVLGSSEFRAKKVSMILKAETPAEVLDAVCAEFGAEWFVDDLMNVSVGPIGTEERFKKAGKSDSSGNPSEENSIRKKMNEIRIPELKLDNATVEEAIEFLRLKSIEGDSQEEETQKGIGFVVRGSRLVAHESDELDSLDGLGGDSDPNASLIPSLEAYDVGLAEALDLVCEAAGLKWEIDPDSLKVVVFSEQAK